MKAKSLFAIALAFAASAVWATNFVWTGGAQYDKWTDSANWSVNDKATDSYPQTADDTATFNDAVTLDVSEENTVGKLILNADLTHNRDKWLNIGGVEGTGKLILKNRGRIRNINGTAVEFGNDIEITAPDGTDWDHREAMPWIQGNGANFDIKGKLVGDGHIFFTMAGNNGVRLYGDNSGFSGTIHVDSNNSNRMKFGEAQSGFENGKLMLYGSVNDNGSMLFSNGVIHFGSIYTKEYATGAKFRSINKNNTLIVGNLNSQDDRITLGMGDDANAHAKIVKVGTGTLELGPTRHCDGTIISNGVLKVTHPDGICHKDSDLIFDGGTLQYGLNPLDENAPVKKDVSSYVKNSTEFISVDTAGNDITWANESLYTNNNEAKGIQKIGEGTLELSGSKREGSWQFFTDPSKINYIYGGVLAIRNGKKSDTPNLASQILGTGTLRIVSEEANGGYRLWGELNAFSKFDGTLEWANELDESGKAVGFMLNNAPLDISRAKVSITGNPESETIVMNGEVNSTRAVTVGAFDHLHPNAILKMKNPWKLNIIGTKGDSYLNGTIAGGVVTVTKTGPGKLTIGPDFSAPDGSTINVNEGTLDLSQNPDLSGVEVLVRRDVTTVTGKAMFGTGTLKYYDETGNTLLATYDGTTITASDETAAKAIFAMISGTAEAGQDETAFAKTLTDNSDGTWSVASALDETAVKVEPAAASATVSATQVEFSIPAAKVKEGLYYAVSTSGDNAAFTTGDYVKASASGVAIAAALPESGGVKYYRIRVADNAQGN